MKKGLFLSLCIVFSLGASAQISLFGLQFALGPEDPNDPMSTIMNGHQRFVFLNPYSGLYTVIDTLDEVKGVSLNSSTFDHVGGRYIFWGVNSTFSNKKLYNVDAATGAFISTPALNENINELQYDMQTQTLYGFSYNNGVNNLVTVDMTTGAITTIGATPPINGISVGSSAFDSNNGYFIFLASVGGSSQLITLDVSDASVVYSSNVPDYYYNELEFDNQLGKLFGIARPVSNPADGSFVEINLETGAIQGSAPMPIVDGYVIGSSVYDQLSASYIIMAVKNADKRVIMVDGNTAQVFSDTIVPGGGVIEIECDNNTFISNFYAATNTLETNSISSFEVFPNPANDVLNIELFDLKMEEDTKLIIIDLLGKEWVRKNHPQENKIDISELPIGQYYIFLSDGKTLVNSNFTKVK